MPTTATACPIWSEVYSYTLLAQPIPDEHHQFVREYAENAPENSAVMETMPINHPVFVARIVEGVLADRV
jgi:hypothetical protein